MKNLILNQIQSSGIDLYICFFILGIAFTALAIVILMTKFKPPKKTEKK